MDSIFFFKKKVIRRLDEIIKIYKYLNFNKLIKIIIIINDIIYIYIIIIIIIIIMIIILIIYQYLINKCDIIKSNASE